MHTASRPQPQARHLEIASGTCQQLALRAGATVICIAGSVRVQESRIGPEAAGSLPLPVSVRINAGEAHGLGYGGVVQVTAIDAAEVICLDVVGPMRRFFRLAVDLFRKKEAEKTNIGVGALHKI